MSAAPSPQADPLMESMIGFYLMSAGLILISFAVGVAYQLKRNKRDFEQTTGRRLSSMSAESDELRSLARELIAQQTRLTERMQNIEAIVTSALWDERARQAQQATLAEATLSDEEQAAALARQIQSQERA